MLNALAFVEKSSSAFIRNDASVSAPTAIASGAQDEKESSIRLEVNFRRLLSRCHAAATAQPNQDISLAQKV